MADKKKEPIASPMFRIKCEFKNSKGEIEEEERDVYQGNYIACRNGRRVCSAEIVQRTHYQICYLRCLDRRGGCQAFRIFKENHPELFERTVYTRKYYRRPKNVQG